jgi:hypothetical protein
MLIESDADAFNDSFEVICTNFKIIKEHAPMFYNKLVDIAYDYLKDGISPKTAPILNRFGSFFSTIKDYNNLLSFFFSFVPKVKNEQFPVLGKQIVNSLLELEKQQDKERIKKEV